MQNENRGPEGQPNNGNPNQFDVTIRYDGMDKTIDANSHQAVQALLQRAIQLFGSPPNPHTLSLFDKDGKELADKDSVGNAGIKPGALLLLRTSTVKGG